MGTHVAAGKPSPSHIPDDGAVEGLNEVVVGNLSEDVQSGDSTELSSSGLPSGFGGVPAAQHMAEQSSRASISSSNLPYTGTMHEPSREPSDPTFASRSVNYTTPASPKGTNAAARDTSDSNSASSGSKTSNGPTFPATPDSLAQPTSPPEVERRMAAPSSTKLINPATVDSQTLAEAHRILLKPRTEHHKLLSRLYRALEYSLQCLVRECDKSQRDQLVDGLLLLQSRLERAETEEDQRRALSILDPARSYLAERLDHLGKLKLSQHLDDVVLRIAPLLSQIPLRVGDWVYALVRMEEEDFRIKITFSPETPAGTVADAVCQKMAEHQMFSETLTAENVKTKVLDTITQGPPVPLLMPRSRKHNPKESPIRRSNNNLAKAFSAPDPLTLASDNDASKKSQERPNPLQQTPEGQRQTLQKPDPAQSEFDKYDDVGKSLYLDAVQSHLAKRLANFKIAGNQDQDALKNLFPSPLEGKRDRPVHTESLSTAEQIQEAVAATLIKTASRLRQEYNDMLAETFDEN